MSKYTIGVDVGGTNIKFGLVNAQGRIIFRTRLETKGFIRNKPKLIRSLVEKILEILDVNNLKKKNVLGVGFGFPGLVDPLTGVIKQLPNIPGWKDVPIKKILESKLRIPIFIENDVKLITLGEWRYGAGRGYQNLICMTLGTGVGSGLVLNNQLYRGENFVAGELGHVPLNEHGPKCNCGGWACYERYVGNQTILKSGQKYLRGHRIERIEDIHALAKRGNVKAKVFWKQMGEQIGNGLIGVINLLNPRLIIMGGGVSNNFVLFQQSLKKIIKSRTMKVQGSTVKISRTQLGDDAGIIGAHVLIKDQTIG